MAADKKAVGQARSRGNFLKLSAGVSTLSKENVDHF
jgi:hypothetical protein